MIHEDRTCTGCVAAGVEEPWTAQSSAMPSDLGKSRFRLRSTLRGSASAVVDAAGVDAAVAMAPPVDAPLPRAGRRLGYRAYPAFTRRWLLGRFRAFGAVLLGLAAAVVLGVSLQPDAPALGVALRGAAAFLVGLGGVAFAGPTLATLVRHARRPLWQERWLVVGALLVGVALAAAIDSWASAVIASTVGGPEPSANPKPAALLFAFGLYGAFGGWLALPAYWSEPGKHLAEAQRLQLERLQRDKQELGVRLGVLQAQVEPHFLFNTLGNIRALVTQRPEDAAALLDALVTYLRAAIPRLHGDALEHTLGEQLELCRAYLEIMRLRLERLSYRVEADESLLAHPFIPLLLLTLVENAVKHGVEPSTDPGEIVIIATRQGRSLCLRVEDSGVGLSALGAGGVGLHNLNAQLQVRYGARAQFQLAGREEGGAVASIDIAHELGAPRAERARSQGHPEARVDGLTRLASHPQERSP